MSINDTPIFADSPRRGWERDWDKQKPWEVLAVSLSLLLACPEVRIYYILIWFDFVFLLFLCNAHRKNQKQDECRGHHHRRRCPPPHY